MSERMHTYLVVVEGGVIAQGADCGKLNQTVILTTVNASTRLCSKGVTFTTLIRIALHTV